MEQNNPLQGRTLYVPEMCYGGARAIAASFRSVGIDATVVPPSTKETLELGGRYTSGDECFPQRVTLGDFLGILQNKSPKECAFFMPTAQGPCRFGQYSTHTRHVLERIGLSDALVYSITSEDGYNSIAGDAPGFERSVWLGVVASDVLRQMLHRTRPFENNKGTTDKVYKESVEAVCDALEVPGMKFSKRKKLITETLKKTREWFAQIDVTPDPERPLIGVVGEIFCRLNTFSNADVVRKLEDAGGWCWVSNVSEWILYTTFDQQRKIRLTDGIFSKQMLISKIRYHVLRKDEHDIFSIFKKELSGYENISDIGKLLKYSDPYLPYTGSHGEMTINAANAAHFYNKGAAGVVDISPFACMNAIVSEAVYPKISEDLHGMPIRVFYFDGINTNIDRDCGIFLELARSFKGKSIA